MLVRVADETATSAGQPLIEWMSGWNRANDPPGVAVFNVSLPNANLPDVNTPNVNLPTVGHADPGGRRHRLDAVVWTPGCCVVVEIEWLAEWLDGELTIPLNGPWTVDGAPIAPSGAHNRTPLDQSRDRTFALQSWFADNELGQHSVRGLVALLPLEQSALRLNPQWTDPSLAVVLGDREARLREYFTMLGRTPNESWTVNDVAACFHRLELDALLPAPEELSAQGFMGPADPALWQAVTAADGVPPWQPAAADEPFGVRAARYTYSPWALYPKVEGESNPGHTTLRVILVIGILVGVAWVAWFLVNVLALLS